ncbi:ASST-domain-containing protein [Fusarium solani]|uniref:ASST-domain-containing protein n=1 Tax=Fusarium solani TaxID=169388 RepID=A0A9P9L349_FUSSL|nr:ASST-domain-containing protein [Fusarium solani]KAH7273108.1 ASST-domain-containing protein [Fusarium solani]
MASFRHAVGALASVLALAGPSLADLVLYNQANEFTTLAEASNGFAHQTFRSSDIVAPILNINSLNRHGLDDAPYIFLGTVYGQMRAGPMILDARDFSLVYADQHYDNSYCSNVQMFNGSRHLVFWEGVHNRGHANGYGLVYDENYNLVFNVTAQGLGGALADMHEVQLTSNGTIIFSAYWTIPYDCTIMGGQADAMLMDSGFQEVDPVTNKILFQWAASQYFSLEDTHARYTEGFGVKEGSGFDFFHINSVEKTEDGNYLISSRHTSTIALIDGTNGHPIWILGGRRNQFRDLSGGRATNFGWQHDARFYKNQSHITMFDNHGEHTGYCDGPCRSRGLHLAINTTDMTVRVVHEYYHPSGIDSGAMGGMQTLESGNVIVGWGYTPSFVEYAPNGTVVMSVQRGKLGEGFQADMFAYRAHKGHWTGRPSWLPSAAVDAPHRTTENATVYLSWNGATDIASWAVLASPYANRLSGFDNLVALANKTGFETQIFLGNRTSYRYMGAAALDKNGAIMGSTFVIDMQNGQPVLMPSSIASVWPEAEPIISNKFGILMIVGCVVSMGLFLGRFFSRRLHWTTNYETTKYERIESEERRIE